MHARPSLTRYRREASLTCRFTRQRHRHAGDKWKTIGPGGSRVSVDNLTVHVNRRPSQGSDLHHHGDSNGQHNSIAQPCHQNGGSTNGAAGSSSPSTASSSSSSSSSSANGSSSNGAKKKNHHIRRLLRYGEPDRLTGAFWHDLQLRCRAIIGK